MPASKLTIHDLGPQGDGIHNGPRGRIYVDRTLPGDVVKARVERDPQGVWRGEVLELVARSPYRQQPPCPHYDQCGGCTLQHLADARYRDWKLSVVTDALERNGVRPRKWLEPVFIPGHTRRRITFSALRTRDRLIVGYHRRRSRQIGAIETCGVAEPRLFALRETLKGCLGPVLVLGKPTDVALQLVGDRVDALFTGPLGRRGHPDAETRKALAPFIDHPLVQRVSWRAHEKEPVEGLAGAAVTATFGGLNVELAPGAFLQPTLEGEQALVRAVMAALPAQGTFADLFSGSGTFSGPMLERGPVDAYESAAAAVKALGAAAQGRKLRAFRRDLFRDPLRRKELTRFDAVVFDPPRAGCEAQAEGLAGSGVRLAIGVSCNPATFARDARILCDGGFWLQSVQVVDQFVWSHHVELVGVFTRKR